MKPMREFGSSKLGAKEYWETFYEDEIRNFNEFGDEGQIWFGKVAENRILRFMIKEADKESRIVDVGCGNGSLLRKLRQNGFRHLCGVDYSENAIQFAIQSTLNENEQEISFQVADLCASSTDPRIKNRFDIVLDKGTWDAISLTKGDQEHMLNVYRRTVEDLFSSRQEKDRFFVIISCNFTLDEIKSRFTSQKLQFFQELPTQQTFTFGGQTGQTTSGAVFRFQEII